jgi:hypothetical protein
MLVESTPMIAAIHLMLVESTPMIAAIHLMLVESTPMIAACTVCYQPSMNVHSATQALQEDLAACSLNPY